jgi:hypothetical protein
MCSRFYDVCPLNKVSRYYIRHAQLPEEEDPRTELKGHKAFHINENNPNCAFVTEGGNRRVTRQHSSKNFCGMLNTGKGGTLYLGVLDNGAVEGFPLSPYQRDHVVLSITHTLNKYTPPVPKHLFSISFIPVLDPLDTDFRMAKKPEDVDDESSSSRGGRKKSQINANLPHELATWRLCWCDNASLSAFSRGEMEGFFVVEVVARPWDPEDKKNGQLIQAFGLDCLRPFFASEDDEIYVRKNATLENVTKVEAKEMAKKKLF